MADSIITTLVHELGKLAVQEAKILRGVENEVKSLVKELKLIKSFLRDSEGKQNEHTIVKELVDQIREVAFQAEDTIETFLLNAEKRQRRTKIGKILHSAEHALMLRRTTKEIDEINQRITKIYENKEKYDIEMSNGNMNPHLESILRTRRTEVDEEVVGFEDARDMLLKQLTEGQKRLDVISIVGMGGLGKTTVAKKLYNDRIIKDHFQSHAWVFVSADYNTQQVILDILQRVVPNIDPGLDQMPEEKLKETLHHRLKGLKYIVILDDVWQTDMWDRVKTCFPDNCNGSRIMITSRIAKVANHASPNPPHFLRFLDEEESWQLFHKKVFRGDPCPPHLITLGRQIAKRCKGLPLSLVVLGSMLATEDKSERVWERTANYVSSYLSENGTCIEILALSYHHLPSELKPCFLYFAAFPEDYEMSARRLIALWMAEGFIQPLGELLLEDIAERYLEALTDRSLVQIGLKRSDGGIKTCRIHDLVRDLCIREAGRDNFFTVHTKIDPSPAKAAVSSSIMNRPRRLSTHRYTSRLILSKAWDSSSVRSLLSFDTQLGHVSSIQWKTLCKDYKLLRVLDLGIAIKVSTVPEAISDLINLRYLRFSMSSSSLPPSLFELFNIQMLFIEGGQFSVPIGSLLKLQRSQQLNLGHCSKLSGVPSLFLSKQPLVNLRTLSSIFPDNDFESAVMKGLFPNLRKLGLIAAQDHEWSLRSYLLGLPGLQSLKISFPHSWFGRDHDIFKGVQEADFPSSLTKVTLKSGCWDEPSMDMFGKFPNIQILKLLDMEYTKLIPKQGSFPKLHTLRLESLSWSTYCKPEEKSLPQLRYLLVKGKMSYNNTLFQLPSLKLVEVLWPEDNLVNSLEKLKQENKVKCRLLIFTGH